LRRIRWTVGQEELKDSRSFAFYRDRIASLGVPFWGFGLVSSLGLLGWVLALGRRRFLVLTVMVALFCVGLGLFHVFGRYRLPLIVPLSLLAAYALQWLFDALRERRYSALAATGAVLGIVVWQVFGPVLPERRESFFVDYYNQGNRYLALGRLEEATEEYEKAWTVRPGDHPGIEPMIIGLADLYLRLGAPDKAEALLRRATLRFAGNQQISEKLRVVTRLPSDVRDQNEPR
jgi:tetratricopeptide (TPR) repeat protein